MSPQQQQQDYRAYLVEKRRLLNVMYDAQVAHIEAERAYNLIDAEEQLRQVEARPGPQANAEDLTQAHARCQEIEAQIEALDGMLESDLGKALGPMAEGIMRPMLLSSLAQATRYREAIQRELEAAHD